MKKDKTQLKPNRLTPKQYEELGRMIEDVYITGYASPKRLIWGSLIKGIGYGFGIFIGGTIVVGLVIWLLTKFNEIPVLNPFITKIVEIVNAANQLPGI